MGICGRRTLPGTGVGSPGASCQLRRQHRRLCHDRHVERTSARARPEPGGHGPRRVEGPGPGRRHVAGRGGRVVWEVSLPLAGIMTSGRFEQALIAASEMKAHLRARATPSPKRCTLCSSSLPTSLPGPRLTWSGVLDVRTGKLVNEAEPIGE